MERRSPTKDPETCGAKKTMGNPTLNTTKEVGRGERGETETTLGNTSKKGSTTQKNRRGGGSAEGWEKREGTKLRGSKDQGFSKRQGQNIGYGRLG